MVFTVHFSGFDRSTPLEFFREEFSHFGNILNIFTHKEKNYGMVTFDNYDSCDKLIKAYNSKAPLYMKVGMAKKQNTEMNDNCSLASSNLSDKMKHKNNYFEDNATEIEGEVFYVDENNKVVNILVDPTDQEIYVPIRYATNIRKIVKQKKKHYNNNSTITDKKINITNDSFNISVKNKAYQNGNNRENHNESNRGNRKSTNDNVKNDLPGTSGNHRDHRKGRTSISRSNSCKRKSQNENNNSSRNHKHDSFDQKSEHMYPVSSGNRSLFSNRNKNFENVRKNDQLNKSSLSKPNESGRKSMHKLDNESEQFNKPFKRVELPKNEFSEVTVQHLLDDLNGWVTLVNKEYKYNQLFLDGMTEAGKGEVATLKVGNLIWSLFRECWFRALIKSTSPDLVVHYVDYGNDETIDVRHTRKMSASSKELPGAAIRIRLMNGSGCVLKPEKSFRIKPVRVENDYVLVQVENGIYENESINKLILKLSLTIKQGDTVLFQPVTKIKHDRYICVFVPSVLKKYYTNLIDLEPDLSKNLVPKQGDIVCAKYLDNWHRVYIIEMVSSRNFKVAFIDVGFIDFVEEVFQLPENFADMAMLTCIATFDEASVEKLNSSHFTMNIDKIKGTNTWEGTLETNDIKNVCFVTCKPWIPTDDMPIGSPKPKEIKTTIPGRKKITDFKEIELTDGDEVILLMECDGLLVIQNKLAKEVQEKIDKYLNEHMSNAAPLSGPVAVNDVVLAPFYEDWYRARIISIDGLNVKVNYIDYGNDDIVSSAMLKELDAKMCNEPIALINIRLQHFTKEPFGPKSINYLEDLAKKGEKFIVTIPDNNSMLENGIILKSNGINISETLLALEGKPISLINRFPKPIQNMRPAVTQTNVPELYTKAKVPEDGDPIFTMSSVPLEKLPMGKIEIILKDIIPPDNLLCVCTNDRKILDLMFVEIEAQISKYIKHFNVKPNPKFVPNMEELVLVQNDGKWYRGACTNIEMNICTIFFIDCGTCKEYPLSQIIKMPQIFVKQKALANFARFAGLPDDVDPKIMDQIQPLLQKNKSYNVEILGKDSDDCYDLKFPTILERLKGANLL